MSENFPELRRDMNLQNKNSPKQDTFFKKKKSPRKHILMKLRIPKTLKAARKKRQITYNEATLVLTTDFSTTIKVGKMLGT